MKTDDRLHLPATMDEAYIDPILSFKTWSQRQPKTNKLARIQFLAKRKNKEPGQVEPRWTPKPLDEGISEKMFFKMRPQTMKNKAKKICNTIIEEMRDAGENIKEFGELVEDMEKRLTGPKHTRIEIAVIGETRTGKSTFINAVLDWSGLADASDSSKACTQYATTYEHLPGAPGNTKVSNIYIVVTDYQTRKEDAQNHISNYAKFYTAVYTEAAEVGEENVARTVFTEEDKNLANDAVDYFNILWKTQNGLEAQDELSSYLQNCDMDNEKLLLQCLDKQKERLRELGANGEVDSSGNISYTGIPDKLSDVQSGALDLTGVRALAAAVWPLIRKLYVRTGGLLLRNGIALTDLPRYGDLNQSRVAIANAFRRNADYEVIIGEGLRLEDSRPVHKQIRSSIHSHGVNRTILIVNKLDAHFHTSDDEVDKLIEESNDSPFSKIRKQWSELENLDEIDESAGNNYIHYLKVYAKSATRRLKSESLRAKMQNAYGEELQVFSTSSKSWLEWINAKRSADPPFGPRMSGIPEVQRHFLDLTAAGNMQSYQFHFFRVFPKITNRVNNILTKSVQEKGYFELRDIIKDNIQHFREKIKNAIPVTTMNASVTRILTIEERMIAEQRVSSLLELWRRRWSVTWATWDYTLRCNGIPHRSVSEAYVGRGVNWNRDLLGVLEKPTWIEHEFSASKRHVEAWKDSVIDNSLKLLQPISSFLSNITDQIQKHIQQAPLSSELKTRFLNELWQLGDNLPDTTDDLKEELHTAIVNVYRKVTTEEDIGCTIAKITKKPFEDVALEEPRGPGRWERQHQKMRSSMAQFVTTYEKESIKLMKSELKNTVIEYLTEMIQVFDVLVQTTEQFFETEVYNTPVHREAREKLAAWLPDFKTCVEEIQGMFPNHAEPTAKRMKMESAVRELQVSNSD